MAPSNSNWLIRQMYPCTSFSNRSNDGTSLANRYRGSVLAFLIQHLYQERFHVLSSSEIAVLFRAFVSNKLWSSISLTVSQA